MAVRSPSHEPDQLLDAPLAALLERLDLLSRKILSGKLGGDRPGRRSAPPAALLPIDYRDYSPGDDERFIDWNVYARLDRLVIKLFAQEEDVFLHLLLDVSASCDYGHPNKALYLRRAAAALAYVGLVNRHHVGIHAFADGVVAATAPGLHGRGRTAAMMRFLAGLRGGGPSRFAQACRQFARAPRHRGLCVVLSDFLFAEPVETGLDILRAAGHELFCVQALSPQELSPRADAGDLEVELVDAEAGEARAITLTAAAIAEYRDNLQTNREIVRQAVQRRDGTYVLVSTDLPVERLVLDHLRRQGMLG